MRILAIRGENLASLSEGFVLDFEAEPLRSAGLFAITGETGAGKSTILDALCLALYDKFPRVVAPGADEGALDPSGKTIDANDPRTILRRGAARGFAEVDFIARDGGRYRARCELMRARGKVTGALQKRGRSLWRIDDSGEIAAAVESGIDPVNARIVNLTDLTFDQFRRTVLLAQGDFDAFLRADTRERGELLEKITGAEIYGRLSKRAFDHAREAQQAVAALEQRCADVGVMADDARAALSDEIAATETQRATRLAQRAETLADLRRHDAIALAQTKLVQADAARAAAARAAQEVAARRETLVAVARAEPLRAPRNEAQRTERALVEALRGDAEARTAAGAAQQAFAAALDEERIAIAASEAAEATFKAYGPEWSKAERLDSQILVAAEEETKARDAAKTARESAQTKNEAQARLTCAMSETRIDLDAAREALERLADAKPLEERWGDIADWLEKRAEFAKQLADDGFLLQGVARDIERHQSELRVFDDADENAQTERRRISEQTSARGEALASIGEPALHECARALERRSTTLRELAGEAARHAEAVAAFARAAADVDATVREAEAEATTIASLREARAFDEARRGETERLGDLADATASREALCLRAALIEGEPCPVCGGVEHPHLHSSEAANEFVAQLRTRRDELRRAIAQADARISEASARAAASCARRDEALRRRDEAAAERDDAMRAYAQILARAPTDAQAPTAPGEGAVAALQKRSSEIDAEREAVGARLATARALRDECDTLRKRFDALGDAIEARRGERETAAQAFETARNERTRLDTQIENVGKRRTSIDGSLAPFLRICDLAVADLDRDPLGARIRLEQRSAAYRDASERAAKLSAALAELAPRAASLEAEARAAGDNAAAAQASRDARAKALDALRAERAAVLEGDATDAHRGRFERARQAAAAARETAREALARAGEARAASDERCARASVALDRAQQEEAAAGDAFRHALEAADLDEAAATALLDLNGDARAALRQAVETVDAASAAAEAAVAARRNDLAEALGAGPPAQTRETLASHDAQLTQELDALARRLGELAGRLAQDDDARRRAQTLSGEIDAARAERKIWDEISEAIGSASGDKFRRFAQGVTLEQLVALANQRLALLAPRYALERAGGDIGALGLQIVDRDMCDERRSTRSLSGGERFLASLALALALAGLEGRDSFVDTLFIDEGFGALDAATLDVALDALEALQGQGRKVGVISHVESLHQRISTQVCVERRGGGVSVVRLRGPGFIAV